MTIPLVGVSAALAGADPPELDVHHFPGDRDLDITRRRRVRGTSTATTLDAPTTAATVSPGNANH